MPWMNLSPPRPPDDALLEMLSELLRGARRRFDGRIIDLYIERRIERRLIRRSGRTEELEIREDGCALRLRTKDGIFLDATNGIDRNALTTLFHDAIPGRRIPLHSPAIPPPVPPPEWTSWAQKTADRLATPSATVHFLASSAAVVRPEGWTAVRTPPLVRIAAGNPVHASLLAPWDPGSIDRRVETLEAAPPRTGWLPEPGTRWPVVFTSGSGGVLLHELVGHMVESDLVAAGLSPLADRSGERIATESLTVVDDPTRDDLPGAFDHDGEGVPAAPRPVLSNGVLSGWLADGEGARRLGGPAGRGRRAGWQRPPVPRMSNLVTTTGTHDPADLEAAVGRGFLITRTGAAMVDPVEGRVVLRIEAGWELLHGRRRRPLAPFHFVGEILGILQGIRPEIGNDHEPDWWTGWCHKDGHTLPTGALTPTLVVDGLEVL